MNTTGFSRAARRCLVVSVMLCACTGDSGDPGSGTTGTDGPSTSAGDTSGTESDPVSTSTQGGTTAAPDDQATTTAGTEDDMMPVECGVESAGEAPEPAIVGRFCWVDSDCIDGEICYVIPGVGGSCGECNSDDDCAVGGCTPPDSLFSGAQATCNLGAAGDGCQTDEACNDPCAPFCVELATYFELAPVSACGACRTDEDCSGETPFCMPLLDEGEAIGPTACVSAGAIPDHRPCWPGASGDNACSSGHCSPFIAEGFKTGLGVCGSCTIDADCGADHACVGADIDVGNAFEGSHCE